MKCARINENSPISFFPNDIIPQEWEEINIEGFSDYTELAEGYNQGKYIIVDDAMALNPDWEHEQEEKEKERINNLTMTPLDFIKVLQGMGLTLEQINVFLDSRLDIKTQLTYCNLVYCGVAKSFLPVEIEGITITPEMIENAFKAKED